MENSAYYQNGKDIKISVVIPAHNEEKYIGKCLESISKAAKLCNKQVEIIVVLNRCSDRTEDIVKSYNCIVIENSDKNLSKIRNAGVEIAKGDIIVTIDADTQMSEHLLTKAEQNLMTGKYIGGGVTGKFERMSLGIFISTLVLIGPLFVKYGAISVGIFWCYKEDFKEINGFNENMLMAEDADFAKRLKEWGKKKGKKYGTIQNGMITSTRKFDKHGDWVLLKRPKMLLAYLKGTDQEYADEAYYENQDR
ncbi:glycosyltransferase [Sporosarcina sp. Te-1]|uniref:glycosyltransferase n=1 Tax=Sporosarcina sp. Te-1 TaxID=2818390 RepID=UPI001A9EC78D|nr:glycosyltransferase [Sporosarcina sp. Te-1]QTD43276.1 glycosyltransferase [Sporosarcina sp. Te-1]